MARGKKAVKGKVEGNAALRERAVCVGGMERRKEKVTGKYCDFGDKIRK